MMNALLDHPETMAPTEEQRRAARAASELLASLLERHEQFTLQPVDPEGPGEMVLLPASILQPLRKMLLEIASGNAVMVVPIPSEFTTEQAADFLNVSRPYVIKLLEANKLPFRKTGTHHRILFQDLKEYKRRSDAESQAALEALAAQAQELGLY